jgi:1-acyl-sn-glycerol-3-phosphate acyltransferase
MAGGRAKKGARKAPRAARPALGNDPFARGAAPRQPAVRAAEPGERAHSRSGPAEPAPAPAPVPVSARSVEPAGAPPPPPAARSGLHAAARKLDDLESRLDAAMAEAERRLESVAAGGVEAARNDLRAVLEALWPALRARLGGAGDLFRLAEPPERLDRFGMDPRLVERAASLVELLYATWWRVEARAIDAVPAAGPVVIVANHAGLVPWDALVLRHALRRDHPARRDLRPLLDDAACDRPFIGAAAVRLGAVRASPDAAARLLGDGGCVAVFPEGSAAEVRPWRDRYRLGRFGRGGFVKVALRAGAAVVPCAVVGSEEASPPISRTGWLADLLRLPFLATQPSFRLAPAGLLPLPSRWSLRFGTPIDLGGRGPEAAEDVPFVTGVAERTRAALQAMLDEDVAARRSVFL